MSRDPDRRDLIPDERTEEEELVEQLSQWNTELYYMREDLVILQGKFDVKMARLREVRAENEKFLKEYCPDSIGSDPCDKIEEANDAI